VFDHRPISPIGLATVQSECYSASPREGIAV